MRTDKKEVHKDVIKTTDRGESETVKSDSDSDNSCEGPKKYCIYDNLGK